MNKVTIITPIKECTEELLHKFSENILKQTYKDFEVLFVLNGFNDYKNSKTKNLIDLMEFKFEYRVVFDSTQTYIGGARNFGILSSRTEYIYFYDLDDEINENLISVCVNEMENNSNLDAVIFNYTIKDGSKITNRNLFCERKILEADTAINLTLSRKINNPCWNKFFRRNCLTDNPFYLNCNGEDYCMPIIFSKCSSILCIPFFLYQYNNYSGSASHNNVLDDYIYDFVLNIQIMTELNKKFDDTFYTKISKCISKALIGSDILKNKCFSERIKDFYKKYKKNIAKNSTFKTKIINAFFINLPLLRLLYLSISKANINKERCRKFLQTY